MNHYGKELLNFKVAKCSSIFFKQTTKQKRLIIGNIFIYILFVKLTHIIHTIYGFD